MFVKTCGDSWVVGKKSDQREFYVVINQKTANLIEINGEPFIESHRRSSCTFGYVATDVSFLILKNEQPWNSPNRDNSGFKYSTRRVIFISYILL